jgi:hypothetical protein
VVLAVTTAGYTIGIMYKKDGCGSASVIAGDAGSSVHSKLEIDRTLRGYHLQIEVDTPCRLHPAQVSSVYDLQLDFPRHDDDASWDN